MSEKMQVWFGYTESARGNPEPFLLYADPAHNEYNKNKTYLVRPTLIELPHDTSITGLLERLAHENPPPSRIEPSIQKHNDDTLSKLTNGETKVVTPPNEVRLGVKLEQAVQTIEKLVKGDKLVSEEADKFIEYLRNPNSYRDAYMLSFKEPLPEEC